MEVTTVRSYGMNADDYAICPNCGFAMEREYQNCCEYCGQRLGWKRFRQGRITYEDRRPAYQGTGAIPLHKCKTPAAVP